MEPADNRQVFDVNRPRKAGADPTSKPIIVGHRPMIPDPMIRKDSPREDSEDEQAEPTPEPRRADITIKEPEKPSPTGASPPPADENVPSGPAAIISRYTPPVIQPDHPPEIDGPPQPQTEVEMPPPAEYHPAVSTVRAIGRHHEDGQLPGEDLTLRVPAGKAATWRSHKTWLALAAGLIILAITLVLIFK